ncbi:MAG: lipopolysaccharide biosynthesis protein [Gemmatimonadota bacterium]
MSSPATPEVNDQEAALKAETGRHLDRSLMHGVAWTGGMKWVTQVFSWAATLIIARLLTPADYGLMTMANIYLGFIALVNEFGLGPAIIRQRDLTEDQISALGGVSVGLSVALWIFSIGVAVPIAWFFEEPAVRWIIMALGVTFVTTGLKVLPRSLLTRDLRFKRVAAIDAIEAMGAVVVTLVLAALGFRYWSLVLGGIVGSLISCIMALRWCPHRRHWPKSFESVKPSILFGWHIVVSRFAWYFYSNADFAIVGRLFDKVTLGGYSFAWSLASIPVTRISSLVGQVTPAIFSAVQDDKEQLKRYMLRLTEGLAFITFPFSVGLALVAREFVLVALGPEWKPAIVPLQLLAFYAGLRSITTLHPQILTSVGRAREQMRYSLLALFVLPPLFFIGGKLGGPAGVAWAWIVGYPLIMIPPYRDVFQVTGITLKEYIASLWPAALGSAGMAAGVLGAAELLPSTIAPVEALIVKSIVGGALYVVLVLGLQRDRLRVLRNMLSQFKR